jgi:hypothetical protein
MKLFYDKKYYKDLSDTAAQKIGEALVAVRRPLHIEVDGEYLKTALIELRMDEPASFARQEITLDEIKKFERKLNEWAALQPEDARSWEFFAAAHNLIRLVGVYTAPSGMKRCANFAVRDSARFTRFFKLYNAMQEYYAKVEFAKRRELQEQEAKMFTS